MSVEAIACTTPQTLLGEGIRWDARRDELLGVDILDRRVFRGRVGDDGDLSLVREYQLPTTVGAVAPIVGDDGWLVAAGRGISHLSLAGTVRPIAELASDDARMNDAACDPQGRFWAGTMAHDTRPGGGALYRLDRDGRTEDAGRPDHFQRARLEPRLRHDVPDRQHPRGHPRVRLRTRSGHHLRPSSPGRRARGRRITRRHDRR